MEKFEDEGRSFFIALADGAVLFLSGQYLYDYGQDETTRTSRMHFRIQISRSFAIAPTITCSTSFAGGRLLQLELVAPPFGPSHYDSDTAPGDGDVIRDQTYDDLKENYGPPKR